MTGSPGALPTTQPVSMQADTSFKIPDIDALVEPATPTYGPWSVDVQYSVAGTTLVTDLPLKLWVTVTMPEPIEAGYVVENVSVLMDNAIELVPSTGLVALPLQSVRVELPLISNNTDGLVYASAPAIPIEFTSSGYVGGTVSVTVFPRMSTVDASQNNGYNATQFFDRFVVLANRLIGGIHNSTQISISPYEQYQSEIEQEQYQLSSLNLANKANGLAWVIVFFAALEIGIVLLEHSARDVKS